MFRKILMAASLATAFSLSTHAAEAKVKVFLGVGGPDYCYRYYNPVRCGGGYGYYPDPGFYDPYPGFYDPYPDFYDRVSCNEARWIVRERGFRDVRTTSCGGKFHAFIAKKRGGIFRIKVYSRDGRIYSIRPI